MAVAALLALITCIAAVVHACSDRSMNSDIPLYRWDTSADGSAKRRWMWGSLKLLREGYNQFRDRPWQIWTSEGYQVVLPPAHVNELKMLPDHTLPTSLREFMLPQYTFRPYSASKLDYVNHVILRDLNKQMAKIFPSIREEVDNALLIDLPTSADWSEFDISAQMLRLTCRVSGKAFVDEKLYRNEEWIDITYNFTKDLFLAALKLRAVPWIFRPFIALLLPDLRRVYRHYNRAEALIRPIVQQRERDARAMPGYMGPSDTIQWMYQHISDQEKKDYYFQGVMQLAITGVSVQSTSKLIVNIVLNLLKYDEYVPTLLEEVRRVLAECNGEWTLESMNRLEKLDSFMKESMRFEPPLTATFQRRALKRIKLADGTVIPQNTLILAPAAAMAFDPDTYVDPEAFDGLRFFKLRQAEGADGPTRGVRQQFVGTDQKQVQFGLGRHACPGRWFAGHVIKLVVASLLLRYDLRFREGEEKPATFLFQTTNMPRPGTIILARRKPVSA